jgi:hypothetical protein
MSKIINEIKPFKFVLPRSGMRKKILDILTGRKVTLFVTSCLLLDLLHQAMYYDNASASYIRLLSAFTCFLNSVYIAEFFLKIYSFGWRGYFSKKLFKYEFFCLLLYTLSLITQIAINDGLESHLYSESVYIRVMRVLRTCTLFRVLMKFRQINNFLTNLLYSMPVLLSMTLLFFIFIFIYGVAGCFIFGLYKKGEILDDYNNFVDIYYAMWTLFRCVTANDWILIMLDYSEVSFFIT